MDFVADVYHHVFKIFTFEVAFALPVFRFDLSLLRELVPSLRSFPDLTYIPPYELLEASYACTAMNFAIGLIKPVVSGMAAAVAIFNEMDEGTKTIGELMGHKKEDEIELAKA